MMDAAKKGILTLIRSAVTGESLPLPADFDLEAALPLIRKHGITTLAFEGAVNCGIVRDLPVMQQLFQSYVREMIRSEGQMAAVEKLCSAFDDAGIDYMPVKGCNMKKLYPKPELRPMGDADILIRVEQYDAIRAVVQAQGYKEGVESDHELIWHSEALHLELHKRLIPSYNKDYYAYFGNGWRLAKPDHNGRFAMSAEDAFVYLFVHFAKHYRDGGIGLRHVTDLWVYRRAVPDMDENNIRRELDKLRLQTFFENTLRLIDEWFRDGLSDEKTRHMTEFIFESGNWGLQENHTLSAGVKDAKEAGSIAGGKRNRILRSLFPGMSLMGKKYPILQKCPFLLPLFWPVRWAAAFLFRRNNLRAERKKLELSTPDRIAAYQQALNYVGLDFHFKE